MHHFSFDFYGFTLVFLLGLRHGLDPDHIAVIDGISLRLTQQQNKLAPWVGTLFAIGHGLVITIIAVGISAGSNSLHISATHFEWMQWIPVILLIAIGLLNFQSLRNNKLYQPAGWRFHFIPKKLITSTKPFSILLVGVYLPWYLIPLHRPPPGAMQPAAVAHPGWHLSLVWYLQSVW